MTVPRKLPSINILGLYSFTANAGEYDRFIQEQIAFRDPANFSEEDKVALRRLGRADALQPFTDEERTEVREEFHLYMASAAVIEALVSNADGNFDVGEFVQPNLGQAEDYWQVAWNEKFLTADGETLLGAQGWDNFAEEPQFRVVFVIHLWKVGLPLRSSYGELSLPLIQPLPERLWRLAPYELPG